MFGGSWVWVGRVKEEDWTGGLGEDVGGESWVGERAFHRDEM